MASQYLGKPPFRGVPKGTNPNTPPPRCALQGKRRLLAPLAPSLQQQYYRKSILAMATVRYVIKRGVDACKREY